MPGGDGTGPLGRGSITGRGRGYCSGFGDAGYGIGRGPGQARGLRRGFGRSPGRGPGWGVGFAGLSRKEMLQEQKKVLERRLNIINKELEDL